MNFQNRFFKHIYNFLSGKKDVYGKLLTERWFNSFDDSQGFFKGKRKCEKEARRRQIYSNIENILHKNNEFQAGSDSKTKRIFSFSYYPFAAAIIIVGIFISLFVVSQYPIGTTDSNRVVTTIKSDIGEVIRTELPDGTIAWLSAKTTIRFPKNFKGDERLVNLEGEAFFDVVHDPDSPFIVKSGEVQSKVLGTSFTVKSYPDEATKVTLATGKVIVSASGDTRQEILTENQQISYRNKNGFSEVSDVDAILEQAWMNRELIFMRESFEQIARTFERWYGVEFVFKDEALKKKEFVYHFTEYSLEESLDILKIMTDFEYELIDKKVFIDSVQ